MQLFPPMFCEKQNMILLGTIHKLCCLRKGGWGGQKMLILLSKKTTIRGSKIATFRWHSLWTAPYYSLDEHSLHNSNATLERLWLLCATITAQEITLFLQSFYELRSIKNKNSSFFLEFILTLRAAV